MKSLFEHGIIGRVWAVAGLVIAVGGMQCGGMARADEAQPNEWRMVSNGNLGPGFSPGLVWSPEINRFVFLCGEVSHEFKGERPYDVMSFHPSDGEWRNELPAGAEARGPLVGNVQDPGFKHPYYAMEDNEGLARPSRRHLRLAYQYAYAPWNGNLYALVCGRVLVYSPKARTWEELRAQPGPMPEVGSSKTSLNWSALCADPVNRELVLFGGGGVVYNESGSPGTWVFSTETSTWRKLDLQVEPSPRALSPMVFDPASRKIVLFGGERLDQLHADTWLYDCATRTWEERKPAVSPSPRYGHALLRLPKSGRIVLLGGKTYTSSTSYMANLYRRLPFEMWSYNIAANSWSLIKNYGDEGGPEGPKSSGRSTQAAVAAAMDDDTVVWIAPGQGKGNTHSSWVCHVDAAVTDAAGTAANGVEPGTLVFRTGSYDPEWYSQDVPAPDPAATAAVLKNIAPNTLVALEAPKWPVNRQGGGWSTVTYDSDRDQILHMGGGHSSYFGNDMAHYDIKTGRWSISARPQFALERNYDLTGPGAWAFNGAPWGGHNYHAYAYDPTIGKVVYSKEVFTMLYDPAERRWAFEDTFTNTAFRVSKYTDYFVTTPEGVVCCAVTRESQRVMGLWRIKGGREWVRLPTTGEPLPGMVTDGSTITYDSKRNRILLTTTNSKDQPSGQVWAADLKTGEVKALSPTGWDKLVVGRFARESVYLPGSDMVLLGYALERDGGYVAPVYDCAGNRWLTAEIGDAAFFNANRKREGCSVDLGLAYDAGRDLVWATLCNLRPGSLRVLRVDGGSLAVKPL